MATSTLRTPPLSLPSLLLCLFLGQVLSGCQGGEKGGTTSPHHPSLPPSESLWNFLPTGPHTISITDFTRVPRVTRHLLSPLLLRLLNLPRGALPLTAVVAWWRDAPPLLVYRLPKNRSPYRKLLRAPHPIAPYRGWNRSKRAGLQLAHRGRTLLFGSGHRITQSIDLLQGREGRSALNHRGFARLLAALKGGLLPPTMLLLSRFGETTPPPAGLPPTLLRAGAALFFPPGWVQVRGVLFFPNSSQAEAYVGGLRNTLADYAGAPLRRHLPWIPLLKALSVHPEGQKVYIQWSATRAHAHRLLRRFAPLLRTLSLGRVSEVPRRPVRGPRETR